MTLPSTPARDTARAAHERFFAAILELALDKCKLTYGRAVTVDSKTCQAAKTDSGDIQSSTGTITTLAATAPSTDISGEYLRMVEGVADGEDRVITAYNTSTKAATHAAFSGGTPSAGDAYQVHDGDGSTLADRMCFNTFESCQDRDNYNRGSKTYSFITEGARVPLGSLLRPYLIGSPRGAPALVDPEKGLARRSKFTVTMRDETDSDIEQDPYIDKRSKAAGSTFWARLIARNPHYSGRSATWRKGFAVEPWDFTTFIDELYTIDSISGPDERRRVRITLKDPLKLADDNKIPVPTDGKLAIAFKSIENSGTAVAAAAATIDLETSASPVDDFYNDDYEAKITAGQGVGQKRKITDYTGATRRATVLGGWSVVPDTNSKYEVSPISIELQVGEGAQYDEYGFPAHVRIGDEIVAVASRSTDKLILTDSDSRAQFDLRGNTKEDHDVDDHVQLCRTFTDTQITTVIKTLLNEAGIVDANIDLTGMADEEAMWLGVHYNITAVLHEPEKVTTYLQELAIESLAMMWWSPVNQQFKFKVDAPQLETVPIWSETAELQGLAINRLDNERITRSSMGFALAAATDDRDEGSNYLRRITAPDLVAEGADAFGDRRPLVHNSRWFGTANALAARIWTVRKLINLARAVPRRYTFSIDPKDYTRAPGEPVDIKTSRDPDLNGQERTHRVLLTRVEDRGTHIKCEARSSQISRRYGFIAPNGTADYPTDTIYAHATQANGRMTNGDDGYLIF